MGLDQYLKINAQAYRIDIQTMLKDKYIIDVGREYCSHCDPRFKLIFSPEDEIAKLFESTKHKCLHILFSDGMYFLKTKFVQESISFEKIKSKNKFYFELKVYNSPGFCSMLCLTILD